MKAQVLTVAAKYGPVLCDEKGEVVFDEVAKPGDASGFFTVGVKAVP